MTISDMGMKGGDCANMKMSLESRVMEWLEDNFDLAADQINISNFPLLPGGKLLIDKANSKHQMVVYCDILTEKIQIAYPQI